MRACHYHESSSSMPSSPGRKTRQGTRHRSRHSMLLGGQARKQCFGMKLWLVLALPTDHSGFYHHQFSAFELLAFLQDCPT